jgi:hypothetical protein
MTHKINQKNVLQSTIGFEALMAILADILERNTIDDFNKDTFPSYITKIVSLNLSDSVLFSMTTKGRKILYYSSL